MFGDVEQSVLEHSRAFLSAITVFGLSIFISYFISKALKRMGCGGSCGPLCGSDPDLCCGEGPGLCCGTMAGGCCGSDCTPCCYSRPGLCCGSGPGLCCGSSPGRCCDSECGPCCGSNNGLCCGSNPGLCCGLICGPCCGVCLIKRKKTPIISPIPSRESSKESVPIPPPPPPLDPVFEYQPIDLGLYDDIFADIDLSDLLDIDPNLFIIDQQGPSAVGSMKTSLNRKSDFDSSDKKYFTHGDSSHIVSELGIKKHACIKSVDSKEMKSEAHKLQIINKKIEQILLERIKEITKREEERIGRHIHDRKIIEEAIAQSGNGFVQELESHYTKLLEEYIAKLHMAMVKYLDDLQKNMQNDKTRLFQKSQRYIEEITSKSQRGKKEILTRIYPAANRQIQRFFSETNETYERTKKQSVGREELRTINLSVYSTTGKYDAKVGCDNIADRDKFIKDIKDEEANHVIKRTVYVQGNPDVSLQKNQTTTQRY